ncbi:MAG: hypothetical protein J6K73_16780 [Clostridia bacterium]|nr:hypothetical protein [Clostridia bacterium]MBP3651428.1 hypothetical protein [Clostridia bacterium]
MYNNVGSKIKRMAVIFAIIGIVVSILTGVGLMLSFGEISRYYSDTPSVLLISLLIMVGGSLLSWIGGFFTYGFGEIIDSLNNMEIDMQTMRRSTQVISEELKKARIH